MGTAGDDLMLAQARKIVAGEEEAGGSALLPISGGGRCHTLAPTLSAGSCVRRIITSGSGWKVPDTAAVGHNTSVGPRLDARGKGRFMCADRLSPEARSRLMSRVRGRDTGPERALRRLLTDLGYRYRLQYKRVPGRPDVALPGRRKVIWMHGCFWHSHPGCPKATVPKSRTEYWTAKLEDNRRRDTAVQEGARRLGWDTLVVWECELSDRDGLTKRLTRFLDGVH